MLNFTVQERFKEFITYWYFQLPKWVWTLIVIASLILFHILLAFYFPSMNLLRPSDMWWSRIGSFYVIVVGTIVVVGFVGTIVAGIFKAIYDLLPDDPRKAKESQSE